MTPTGEVGMLFALARDPDAAPRHIERADPLHCHALRECGQVFAAGSACAEVADESNKSVAGHDGYCYGKATSGPDGSINRTHWFSKDGKYRSHHWYETKHPTNAKARK